MIEFEAQNGRKNSKGERLWGIDVRLEGKIIGEIRTLANGFQYFPKGRRTGGEVFGDLKAIKQSLIGD